MARFSYNEADKYGSTSSGGSYFSLKNDGDKAEVRLLGRDMNDFPGYSVHEVEVGDRTVLVNCLREYNDPIDVCPFCAAKKKIQAKIYIPLYNYDDGEIQMWNRGKSFIRTLSSYCAHNKDVSEVVTEIERQGKAGDMKTTYGLYKVDMIADDEKSLEDMQDEIPEVLGRYVFDKTADDMEYYLKHGDFPSEDSDDAPVRRRGRDKDDSDREERSSRRTSRNRSDEEEF
jgi:hypothetical protein